VIFVRSSLPQFRHYSEYREYLRVDFQNRCAYCLVYEGHKGGEANFEIDHHRPKGGKYARPDLEHKYINLYWVCRVCNSRKSESWSSTEEKAQGYHLIDPCEAWGDHDLHWRILPNGEIEWLPPIGEYTIKMLMFDTDKWLKHHWQNLFRWQQQKERLELMLTQKSLSPERNEIEQVIESLEELLTPLILDKPRRAR